MNTGIEPASVGATQISETAESPARSVTKAEVYARAEGMMRRGKRLVISGFAVSLVGIIGYCVVSLSASINEDVGASFLQNPGPLVGPALVVLGLGTLLWLVGSFLYLRGAMDSDPDGPDPNLF
ncbi:MAG: hypothetical protein EDR02_18065 [Actinobacteria bacterium]|nr:MAG: hypothetical protein EDR02_18065 [Actinomycetota bacterium]